MAKYQQRFPLGRKFATPGALDAIGWEGVVLLMARHVRGDWGDLCEEDKVANEVALKTGARIFSAYKVRGKNGKMVKIWVITEADRSATTALLPEEY